MSANYTSEFKGVPAPDLPEEARLDPNLGLDGCPWLDEYIEFSRKWSPDSYDGYHESIGLWILSAVAGRRVPILFGKVRYTSLYILLIGRTTLQAKSSAVDIAKQVMLKAHVDFLLLPEDITPQRMIMEMSVKYYESSTGLSEEFRNNAKLMPAFGGQRGWYYDEFGANLQAMMRSDGPYADFSRLLRILDDTPSVYSRSTLIRGNEEIKKPYLALLGCLTPADLVQVAKVGGRLWRDGYLARMVLVIPPEGLFKDERFPDGEMIIPESLWRPIREWHESLGSFVPGCEPSLALDPEVKDAYYYYRSALLKLLSKISTPDFDGNYGRFPEKALRVAALFASKDGNSSIKMKNWAKAQGIVERWRRNLHETYRQVNQENGKQNSLTSRDKVKRAIIEKVNPTKREIEQFTGLSAAEVKQIIDKLIAEGSVKEIKSGKTNRYVRTSQIPKTEVSDEPEM